MTTTNPKPRGRRGGRKPGPTPPIQTVSIRLRPDQIEWIEEQGNRQEVIQDIIDREMKKT